MNDILSKIKEARSQGYSDSDIANHLSKSNPKVNEAIGQGYSLDDIAKHFEGPSTSGTPPLNPTAPGNTYAAEDIIPPASAMVGSGLGALTSPVTGPLGPIAGAVSFGLAGESARNLIRGYRGKSVPATPMESIADSGGEGVRQGAAAALGLGVQEAIPGVAKAIGAGAGNVGGLMTGSGGALKEAAKAGFEGGKPQAALIDSMRGSVSEKSIANDALDALQAVKQARSKAYVSKMEKLQGDTFQKKIDLTPIKTKLDDLLNNFNIKRGVDGALDVSRAAADDPAVNEIARIAKTVDDWGSQAGDNTVKGLDILKRKIDDFYSPSSEARSFVVQLKNSIKSTITDKFPKYSEITKGYQNASDVIDDITGELGLGPNAKAGNIVRRLQRSLRNNNDLAKEFVDVLDKVGHKNLSPKIAGSVLDQWMPSGLIGQGAGAAEVGSAVLGHPASLLGAPFLSPRIMGESALKVGQAARFASPLNKATPQVIQGLIGAKRAKFPPFNDENQ